LKKQWIVLGLALFFFFSFFSPGRAQSKMPVKINLRQGEGNYVGERLMALVRKRIEDSESLKMAGEESYMLIVDVITMKIKGRPSTAYSYVVTFNAYGRLSPVLMHRLGICGNTRVYNAAMDIVSDLQSLAATVRKRMKKPSD